MEHNRHISFSVRFTLAIMLVVTSVALTPIKPARAAAMTVTSLADTTVNDGVCTLREAITNANADAATWADCPAGTGADIISFSVTGTITLTSNLPQITDADGLTIDGGSNITISGNSLYRIFDLATNPQIFSVLNITLRNATASSGPALRTQVTSPITLTNVTFSNNTATTLNGGAIYFNSAALLTVLNSTFTGNAASNAAGDGGAIYLDLAGASLNISNSTFTGNSAGDDAGAIAIGVAGQIATITNTAFRNNTAGTASTDGVEGGALRNFGTTTITLSSFVGNQITTANDINVRGGAIVNNGGTLTIANSTFSGNGVAKNNIGATGGSQGGAIYTTTGATINAATFSGNSTSQTGTGNNNGGNIFRLGGVVNLASTIVNAGTPNNCSGTITDGGYNLDSGTTCGFTQPTSLNSTNPNLGALTGTPDYFPLNTGSLAINGGPATCAAAPVNGQSQNGLSRPQGTACDIGSYEAVADTTPPTVTMSSAASNPTNTSPIAVTVQFSETVTGFVAGDITPGNGSVSNFVAVDGDTYTFDLTPSGSGLVTADIAASAAIDAANNGNTAATQFSRTYDNTQPTVTMSSAASNPTNTSPIAVTVQFSETVTGFVAGDITPGNGSVSNFVAVDGDTYTFDLIPSGSGLVTADIAASAAIDAANNGNTAATQFSRTYDNTQPTVTMSSAASNPTGVSPIAVTVQFSETVTGFVAGDIVPGNGSVSNFVAVDGDTYTFDLIPSSSGLVTADIAASVAIDAANNGNTAATQFSRTYDNTQPTVTMSSAASNPTGVSPIAVTVQFSETVTGFVAGDIVPGNGSVSNFVAVDGDTYTFDLTPSSSGLVTADIAAGVASDVANNGNTAATQFSRTYDNTQPTVTMSSGASNPTNTSSIAVTVQFSETVTGFVAGDITPGNGSVSNFVAVDGDTYTFDLTPSSSGLVTADIAAGVATNSLGTGNTAATQFSRTYDNTQPTVTMSSAASNPTGVSPIAVTVQFSETVTGFVAGDIVPGNGSVSNFVAVDGDTYTFDLIPSSSGLVTADIAASAAIDAANNGNTAATQFSRTYDNNLPVVVSILRANPSPTTASSVAFTVNLSKNVTGVSASNFTVVTTGAATGTVFNVTGSNSTYTVVVNLGTGTGTVGLNMTNSTGVTDGAANPVSSLPFVGQVYLVDFTSPLVASNGINTVADTGDGHLDELEIVTVGVSQLLVHFNEDLSNPSGDTGADDVTNPANFILVHDIGSGIHTTACNLGVTGGDSQVTVNSVNYTNGGGSGPFLATLNLNNGSLLPNGVYRLLVCGSTSLTDLVGNELAGDGTNTGTDFVRNFVVAVTNNSGGNTTTNTSKASVKASALPDTGFAPNVVSWLPAQPAEKMYAVYSDLILEIPSLNLKTTITGVPNLQDGWDVTWLGKQAGYLQGSAFPTTIGNSIITGHVWDANNNPGIFFGLKDLRYGDKVLIHAWGKVYTYEIQSQSRVLPSAVKAILKQDNQSWITLLTCESYNEKSGKYAYRRVVRAVLVSVAEDK